ncbi:PAS domain-containing sensor histidine kinase [Terrimonas alba]|uniref:PAS domain-containing sensor histidine kinase n=1 Tax=Terrimonas alba TaxID=3349636 RepID=UPI0035F4B175
MNKSSLVKALDFDNSVLNDLADQLSDAIIVTNNQFAIEQWNQAAAGLFGFSSSEAFGKVFFQLLECDTHEVEEVVAAIPDDAGKFSAHVNCLKKTGEKCWVRLTISRLKYGEGPGKIVFICREKAKAEEESLFLTEQKWRSVLNNSRGAFYILDADYRILLVNEQAKKLSWLSTNNSSLEEGDYFPDILPEARKKPVKEILDRVIKGEKIEYEIFYPNEKNKGIWLAVGFTPIQNEQGLVSQICVTSYDITLFKENEKALTRSEQRWKFALDGAGDGVWDYNFQTKEIYYSPLYKKMLGYADDEFHDEAYEWQSRVHPDDYYKIVDIDSLYEDHSIQNHSIEYRIKSKSGDYVWVLDRGMLLERTPDGKPLNLIGTHTNITERKIAEQRLMQSEHRFSSFMDNSPTLAWIVDENTVLRYLNNAFLKAFGLTKDAIGKNMYDIFSQEVSDQFLKSNKQVFDNQIAIEVTETTKGPDGKKILYHSYKFPLDSEDGVKLLGGIALDITKRTEMELQLAADEASKKKEIIQAIINAQEKERKELAYELHDNVNQILSSCKLMLQVATEKPELCKQFTARAMTYLQDAINEIRKISHNLTPAALRDISLEAAVEEVIQNINATGILRIVYHKKSETLKDKLKPETQLAILRIIQEQFNNILKHAHATEATISLTAGNHKLILEMEDNGQGFDPVTTKRGLGLNNMFNRVEYYQGAIEIHSTQGKGCRLLIAIPFDCK